jgi:hypothetical protein
MPDLRIDRQPVSTSRLAIPVTAIAQAIGVRTTRGIEPEISENLTASERRSAITTPRLVFAPQFLIQAELG